MAKKKDDELGHQRKEQVHFAKQLGNLQAQMADQNDMLPERRLLWAMIKRWLLDYTGVCFHHSSDSYPLEARFDAANWAWSDSHDPFSFLWVCDVLELDAEWLRRNADKTASRAELVGPLLGRIGTLEI